MSHLIAYHRDLALKSPIKELGLHEIEIKLHPEVSASVIINVARALEEAKLQASGKSIQDLPAEKEQEDSNTLNVVHRVVRVESDAIQRDAVFVLVFLNLDAIRVIGTHLVQRQDV